MKISVITVCYNSSSTLADTIRSVLTQDCPEVEYVIVDGGSKDGTVDIIRGYEPDFGGRLKWVSEPDKGLYDAMNKGLSLATGDVVGFLNSDDFFTSPGVLSQVRRAFLDNDIEAVHGDVHFCDSRDTARMTRYYSSKGFRPGMLRLGFMPPHPSFYALRSLYHGPGCFDISFSMSADFELMLRLFLIRGLRSMYLPVDFVTMRAGGVSTSGWKSWKRSYAQRSRAYRKNKLRSCALFQALGYGVKVWQLILFKMGLLGR